jgi:hypothetical protein
MMNALARAHGAAVQMVDTSVVRVHQPVPAPLATDGNQLAGQRARFTLALTAG